jgi:hypothetical protein
LVAITLAYKQSVCIFPTYGMRETRDGGTECECMPAKRRKAKREGGPTPTCHQPAKHPRITGWQDKATTDPRTIIDWRKQWPSTNFSAATGTHSGIWILDVDGFEGFASLEKIKAELCKLPPTRQTQSGSGNGAHFWWRLPPGVIVRNSTSAIASGIDVRGEGGQILLPSSRHESGGLYRWQDGHAPDEVELSEAPAALLRLALEACKKTRNSTDEPADPGAPLVRRPRSKRRNGPRGAGLAIGDGEGRGGFHGPINGIAIKYFGTLSTDADAAQLKRALRTAISSAPASNHEPSDIERYASDAYLDDAIESARNYVKRGVA